MADRPAHREAPETEIEITPEMIEAGAEVIFRSFDGVIPYGSSYGERVAVSVFLAMRKASGSPSTSEDRDQYSPEETAKRFEAALRGARIAGAKHKSAPKRMVDTKQIKGKKKPGK